MPATKTHSSRLINYLLGILAALLLTLALVKFIMDPPAGDLLHLMISRSHQPCLRGDWFLISSSGLVAETPAPELYTYTGLRPCRGADSFQYMGYRPLDVHQPT